MAEEFGIDGYQNMSKEEILEAISNLNVSAVSSVSLRSQMRTITKAAMNETIVNSKDKVVNWKKANSITSYYQKFMTARFGREYAAELFSYCNNQIEKRADVISQIDSAFEKGLEIVTLTQGKQQKLFFTKGDEKLLKAYRKKLATEAKEYQKYINDIQYFIDSEYKDNEKVD